MASKTLSSSHSYLHFNKWNLAYVAVFLFDIGLIFHFSSTLLMGIDYMCFRNAALALLSGSSPYTTTCYLSAPWMLIPFIPLAGLDLTTGWVIFMLCGILSFLFITIRLGAKPWVIIAFMLSPAVLYDLTVSNVSWMVAFGLILPPWIGLFFILIKPQLGAFVAIFWFVEAWRTGGLKKVIKTFAPVTIAFMISFIIFGLWPVKGITVIDAKWNVSMFPLSIPIGILLLYESLKTKQIGGSILGTPFISPYIGFHTFSFATLGLINSPAESILVSITSWLFVLIRGGWSGL